MKITKFEEIKAWQEARKLTNLIYKITSLEKFKKDYGLSGQIQRASVSIMANVAEGFERGGSKEFLRFLKYASSSNTELKSHLYVTLDQDYITKANFEIIYKKSEDVGKLINGFIVHLKKK